MKKITLTLILLAVVFVNYAQFQQPFFIQPLSSHYDRSRLLDLDADGDLDVVLETQTTLSISEQVNPLQFVEHVLFTNAQIAYSSFGNVFHTAQFFDLNGDGLLDFIQNKPSAITVRYNLGGLSFSSEMELVHYEPELYVGGGVFSFPDLNEHRMSCLNFTVSDLDADGLPELIVAEVIGYINQEWQLDESSYRVVKMEFDGGNLVSSTELFRRSWLSYDPSSAYTAIEQRTKMPRIASDDLDNDGDADLCFFWDELYTFYVEVVYFDQGILEMSSATDPLTYWTGAQSGSVLCDFVNFDSDASLELLTVGWLGIGNVDGFEGTVPSTTTTTLTYDTELSLEYSFSQPQGSAAYSDVNADGFGDVVFIQNNGFSAVGINNGNGSYTNLIDTPGGPAIGSSWIFYTGLDTLSYGDVGDVDEDGFQDLLILSNDSLYLLSGNPDFDPNQQTIVSITTFLDENANGNMDANEYEIASAIHVTPGASSFYTQGHTEFSLGTGSLTFAPVNQNHLYQWQPASLFADAASGQDTIRLHFGAVPVGNADSISVSGYFLNSCFSGSLRVVVSNSGTTALHGTVDVVADPLMSSFSLSPLSDQAVALSSASGNELHLTFNEIPPLQTVAFWIDYSVPQTTSVLGEEISFVVSTNAMTASGTGLPAINQIYSHVITCAYDPNYKEVHTGYTEHKYVEDGSWLNYTIHFQNTGNAAASLVYIQDQLSADLDWITLQPIDASHEFATTLGDNGMVEFRFENINLPDSASNPEGSQGYVAYRIKLRVGLSAFAEVPNTAAIYFESNEPVITNTVKNTIYYCSDLQQNNVALEPLCEGSLFQGANSSVWVESVQWSYDGQTSSDTDFQFISTQNAPLVVELSNALCQYTESWNVEVNVPSASFTINGNTLTASEGVSYEWFVMNGEMVSSTGVTTQTFEITQSGNYAVLITDANGCSAYSAYQVVELTAIHELANPKLMIYPNPVRDELTIILPNDMSKEVLRIYDAQGKLVIYKECTVSGKFNLSVHDFPEGLYTIHSKWGNQKFLVE